MKRTNRPKAQHYVPQFYLRNFAKKRKSNFYINCFDKENGSTFQANVKNVAHQTYFYNFKNQNGEVVSIEPILSKLEGKVKPLLFELVNNPTSEYLQQNIENLSYFVCVQELRTLVFRDEQDEILGLANKEFGFPVFKKPTQNDATKFQTLFILDKVEEISKVLQNMKWILVINRTMIPFWTSDNPVFRYNPNEMEYEGNLGILSKGVEIHFPITPKLSINICDPDQYKDIPFVLDAYRENVKFVNSGQVINSRQYLFSCEYDFSMATEMISKHSMLANPKRNRMNRM